MGIITMKKIHLKNYQMNVAKGLSYMLEEIQKEGGYIASSYKTKMEKIDLINYETGEKETSGYFGEWLFISFVLGNDYYYVQFDNNPFFDDEFQKQPLKGDAISRDVYLSTMPDFFDYGMSDEQIKEVVHNLLSWLKDQKYSEKHTEYKRQRVYNLYDGGYHYEKIKVKERTEKIHKVDLL